MRIVCPACQAEYDVPDSVAGAGRKVRCARCQTVWVAADTAVTTPAAAETPAAETPRAPPVTDATPRLFADPDGDADGPLGARRTPVGDGADGAAADAGPRPASMMPWIAAWVVSLALVGGAGWAAYHWRAEVMRLWPASERLYALLGPAGG